MPDVRSYRHRHSLRQHGDSGHPTRTQFLHARRLLPALRPPGYHSHPTGVAQAQLGLSAGRTHYHLHHDDGGDRHSHSRRGRHVVAHDHRHLLLRYPRERVGRIDPPYPLGLAGGVRRPRHQGFLRGHQWSAAHSLEHLVGSPAPLAGFLRLALPDPHLRHSHSAAPVDRTRASGLPACPGAHGHAARRCQRTSRQALFQKQHHVVRFCHPLCDQQRQCPAPLLLLYLADRNPDQPSALSQQCHPESQAQPLNVRICLFHQYQHFL